MVTPTRPSLVVDIGGTLLVRSRPGPVQRCLSVLRETAVDISDPRNLRLASEAVLTGANQSAAVLKVAEALRLGSRQETALREALEGPEGEPSILPGALQLLESATAAGWSVVAATNAAAWLPALPAPLAAHVDRVVSSSSVGLIKQEVSFWRQLQLESAVDPSRTLVIGNNTAADVAPARRAGFLAMRVGPDRYRLHALAAQVAAAGPNREEALGLVGGEPRRRGKVWTLGCAHLTPFLYGRLPRRGLLSSGDSLLPATLLPGRIPALALDSCSSSFPRLAWFTLPRASRVGAAWN